MLLHGNDTESCTISYFCGNIKMNAETKLELLIRDSSLSTELKLIAEKVRSKQRISFDEGLFLYEKAELGYLGILANYIR